MRSLLIEFHRFGALTTGLLRKGDRYISVAASHPVREVEMPIDYEPFLEDMQALRYKSGVHARDVALQNIQPVVTQLLGVRDLEDVETGDFPLQLDLVVNAAELGALPFEASLDRSGQPILLRANKPVILTRRVRNDFAATRAAWPAVPRMLFIWAHPDGVGVQVPHEQHEAKLRNALSPWIPGRGASGVQQDTSGVLYVLEKASLDSIEKTCRESVEQNRPFTHIHLLAHGYPVGNKFGLALHESGSDDLEPVRPDALVKALAPLADHAVVLSLAACDAANETNTVIPRRSIAHDLHVAGFPVVVTSQLPLTVAGSTILTETFYADLLAGKDVRNALHDARLALFKNSDVSGHDWASLVGYVRLPEGYSDYLETVRLESAMMSLRALRVWSDELLLRDTVDPAEFDRLVGLLQERVQELDGFLQDANKQRRGVVEENLGLLGTSEKRLSELYFEYGKRSTANWRAKMNESLDRARSWYRKGFDRNLSHHWSGVQFLSLEAVITGIISDPEIWETAVLAARNDSREPDELWAFGSLAELYMIAPAAGKPDQLDKAVAALETLKGRLAGRQDQFPRESTRQQLQRYVGWWTNSNGFFPGRADFVEPAKKLVSTLG